jgi:hypothetical protein
VINTLLSYNFTIVYNVTLIDVAIWCKPQPQSEHLRDYTDGPQQIIQKMLRLVLYNKDTLIHVIKRLE